MIHVHWPLRGRLSLCRTNNTLRLASGTAIDEYRQRKFALLIDGETAATPMELRQYFGEVHRCYSRSHSGSTAVVSLSKVYGDFIHSNNNSTTSSRSWLENVDACEYGVQFVQDKFDRDSSLIIDAMDLMNSKSVDGFCLVSNTSRYSGNN